MRKILRWIGIGLIFLLILASIALWSSGNDHLFKAVAYTYLRGKTGPGIDDLSRFPYRAVSAGEPQDWPVSEQYNKMKLSSQELKSIKEYDPVALLIIRRDSILFEQYWDNYSKTSYSNSFSVAKTVVGLAAGVAIKQKLINHIDDKVSKYLPEFNQGNPSDVTVRHLIMMNSGINFNEHYGDPFGFMAKAYYGNELEEKTLGFSSEMEPGSHWQYLGGNTLLLAMIIKEVSGMPLSDFVAKNIWSKIGAESSAKWSLDAENGVEKAFCCYYSNARDFARIGKLYLDSGRWNGEQIIPEWYALESIKPVKASSEIIPHYGYHIWRLNGEKETIYYARGILGQYILCIPEQDMIVVRLGHKRGQHNSLKHPEDVYLYLDFARKLYD